MPIDPAIALNCDKGLVNWWKLRGWIWLPMQWKPQRPSAEELNKSFH